jgi:hypothetical protein
MAPGEIFRHEAFYSDGETGELRRKYFVVLATLAGGDLVVRLLTSKPHGRPENPKCFLGHPYPSFFLGVPGGDLGTKTWVDLRYLDDIDALDMRREVERGIVRPSTTLFKKGLISLLECAAAAQDTTQRQERVMRDLLAAMR